MCECDCEREIEVLRAENEWLREKIDAIPDWLLDLSDEEKEATRELIEDATERHDDPKRMSLGEQVDGNQSLLNDTVEDCFDLEEDIAELQEDREDVETAREQAEEAVERVERFETTGTLDADTQRVREGVGEHEMEWMERFHHFGGEEVKPDANRRQHRVKDIHARELFRNLPDWAFKAQNGDIVLKTSDGVRAKLSRRLDEDLEYSELYRACSALGDRMGAKLVWFTENQKIGKHLRIPANAIDDVAIDLSVVDVPQATSAEGRAAHAAMMG